jgi:tryptophan-rich sensory protein
MNTPAIVAGSVAVAVMAAGGVMTHVGVWYRELRKPRWNPPNWLFGPAWSLILGLAAWGGVLAWDNAATPGGHVRVLVLFAINIPLHVLWSPLFFNLRRPDWALMEVPFLWLSVLALVIGLAPLSLEGSLLVLPYLLWMTFAAYLNFTIVRLNR